jgi:hypothetical protein
MPVGTCADGEGPNGIPSEGVGASQSLGFGCRAAGNAQRRLQLAGVVQSPTARKELRRRAAWPKGSAARARSCGRSSV